MTHVHMTKEELIELLKEQSDTSLLAGSTIALESLEESLKDWRFNLFLRLFPGSLLRTLKKTSKEVSSLARPELVELI